MAPKPYLHTHHKPNLMARNGTILLIGETEESNTLIANALTDLGLPNPIQAYTSGTEALEALSAMLGNPFLILSDVRLTTLNGLDLRKRMTQDAYLMDKATPFIFYTGAVSLEIVDAAWKLQIQGFYRKALTSEAIKAQLSTIITYWSTSLQPTDFEQA